VTPEEPRFEVVPDTFSGICGASRRNKGNSHGTVGRLLYVQAGEVKASLPLNLLGGDIMGYTLSGSPAC
jgi:hypothetical protein